MPQGTVSIPTARIEHRLDYETSGIILPGQDADSRCHHSMQLQNRQIRKRYLAVVAGAPTQDNLTVDHPLRCDWDNRALQVVDNVDGKPAKTHSCKPQQMSDR